MELLRIPCGGWRRPFAFSFAPGGMHTFAYLQQGRLHVQRQQLPMARHVSSTAAQQQSSPAGLESACHDRVQHRSHQSQLPSGQDMPPELHEGTHGREILSSVLLDSGRLQLPAVLVTGAEDGTLRRVLCSPDQPSAGLHCSAPIGDHTAGTAVRALAAVPLPQRPGQPACALPDMQNCWPVSLHVRIHWTMQAGAEQSIRNASA